MGSSSVNLFMFLPGSWMAVAHWRMPGEAMLFDGEEYPHFDCFAGSRRRCKVWIRRLGERLRREIKEMGNG